MKIRELQLKNIGVFDDEKIEFPPCKVKNKAEIHILTGQNGSGKTTILMALAAAFHDWPAEPKKQRFKPFTKRFRFFEYDGEENFVFEKEDELKSQIKVISDEGYLTKVYANPTWWNSVLTHTSSESLARYRDLAYSEGIPSQKLEFGAFAFSGYRYLKSEQTEALSQPKEFNPLSEALEFIKDYDQKGQLTINQLIANNISKEAIEQTRNKEKANKFSKVITSIERIISEITGSKIKFNVETEPFNLTLVMNKEELDFDVLPDGLRSLISWVADLLARVDLLKWKDDLPIFEKNLILFLDEIEVHLHPAWQRKVLPVIQKLFKNSQIFVSTHSPFVVNSVDNAWIYILKLNKNKAKVLEIAESENSYSITQVLRDVLGIDEWFGDDVQKKLERFENLRLKILSNGSNKKEISDLQKIATFLIQEPSDQLKQIVRQELEEIKEKKGIEIAI